MGEKIRLYLSHPSTRRKDIRKKQKEIEKKTIIKFVNPFDYEFGTCFDKEESNWVVKRDLMFIDITDGILAFMDKKDIKCGTCMEIFYAYLRGKPVFVITKDMENHPWIQVCATKIYKNYKEFIKEFENEEG